MGVVRSDAEQVIVDFRGAGRRLEPRGEANGIQVVDSYAHHPAEIEADIAAIRERSVGRRVLVLFQPHLYSRTVALAHEFAAALASADGACVTDVYPAREEPLAGVSGRLIVDELALVRPGMRIGWAPTLEEGAAVVSSWARPGDMLLTLGAGDVDRAAPLLLEALS
jgi:UDP-N-acetylmuramate--alanine ligase